MSEKCPKRTTTGPQSYFGCAGTGYPSRFGHSHLGSDCASITSFDRRSRWREDIGRYRVDFVRR